ncbi:MAG: hypothetical protein WAN74_00670 [Thermoplasmata archaeon]
MSERVLCVDVDSVIPNLALMKLSAWHKSRGDEVALSRRGCPPLDWGGRADRAYVSCVFSWNQEKARRMVSGCRTVHYGGQGIRPGWSCLVGSIERTLPDYSLYGTDIAVGFCNRGCPRKCGFCSVPYTEGPVREDRYMAPWEWVPESFTKVLLLDNEMADYPFEQQAEIYGWFRDTGRKWCQTQGYDLRFVAHDERLAPLLADYKPWDLAFGGRRVYCAWDYMANEPWVRRGIERLLAAGFRGPEITCYTIVGFNTTHAQDLRRLEVLWGEYGVHPFIMPFDNRRDDPWIRAFARYVNRRIFKTVRWEDYDYGGFRAADHPVEGATA